MMPGMTMPRVTEILSLYDQIYKSEVSGDIDAVIDLMRTLIPPQYNTEENVKDGAFERLARKVYTRIILQTLAEDEEAEMWVMGRMGWLPADYDPESTSISKIHFGLIDIPHVGPMVINLGGVGGVTLTTRSIPAQTVFLGFDKDNPAVKMWPLSEVSKMQLRNQPIIPREALPEARTESSSLAEQQAALRQFHQRVDQTVKKFLATTNMPPDVKQRLSTIFAPLQLNSLVQNLASITRRVAAPEPVAAPSVIPKQPEPVITAAAGPSNSQTVDQGPIYNQIYLSTKTGLEDAFLDITDEIENPLEREALLRRAMSTETRFQDVTNSNVRMALQMISSFWNNTNNAATNFHGYSINANVETATLIRFTQAAIASLVEQSMYVAPKPSQSQAPEGSTLLEEQLFVAVRKNNADEIRRLMNQGANPNVANARGWTPLFAACRGLKQDAVEALLAYPAVDVNIATTATGFTPLMAALDMSCQDYFQHAVIIDRLLERGAQAHLRSKNDSNALQIMQEQFESMTRNGWSDARLVAGVQRYGERLSHLINTNPEAGASFVPPSASVSIAGNDIRDFLHSRVTRPVQYAAPSSSHQTPEASSYHAGPSTSRRSLSFFQEPVKAKREAFFNALLVHDLVEVENMLTVNPQYISLQDSEGNSALWLATYLYLKAIDANKPQIQAMIQLLLARGADIHQENNDRANPLDMAINHEEGDLVQLMLENSTPAP